MAVRRSAPSTSLVVPAIAAQVGTPTLMSLAHKRRSAKLGAGMDTLVRMTKSRVKGMSARRRTTRRKPSTRRRSTSSRRRSTTTRRRSTSSRRRSTTSRRSMSSRRRSMSSRRRSTTTRRRRTTTRRSPFMSLGF